MKPTDTIIELGRSPVIDELTGTQLVIYIKLLSLAGVAGKDTIQPTNAEIYSGSDARTCGNALTFLEESGLVKLSFDRKRKRTIVVVTK